MIRFSRRHATSPSADVFEKEKEAKKKVTIATLHLGDKIAL